MCAILMIPIASGLQKRSGKTFEEVIVDLNMFVLPQAEKIRMPISGIALIPCQEQVQEAGAIP